MLIDTHSHINSEKLDNVREEILSNLKTGRVGRVICPSYSFESSKTSLEVAQNDRVWCALGVHPENCMEYNAQVESWLRENLSNKKVVAVGEIGLDYHYGDKDSKLQHKVCEAQIELAHEFDLPIIFHMRDAWPDTIKLLKSFKNEIKRGVVHCFDGDRKSAEEILALGFYLSFTGLITYPGRQELREIVKIVPKDRLMVETDAPYLAPQEFRGKVNRPEYVASIADMVASLWEIEISSVDDITTQNAKAFFDRMGE